MSVEVVLQALGACILSQTWRVDPTRHDRFSRVCEVDMWSYAWCTGPINDAWEKEKKSISKTCSWPLERS